MRQNPLEQIKYISPEKQELLKMEKEGIFVFHGTRADVDELKPCQAIDKRNGPDGEPAVFASSAADMAIFLAVVNSENLPEGIVSESGTNSDNDDGDSFELEFKLPPGALDNLPDSASGWVYVFKKEDFEPVKGSPVEYVCKTSIQPIRKIRVSKQDLPNNIGTI